MQIKKFIKCLNEIKPTYQDLDSRGIPISELDKWEIDVLDDEFNAYDGPIYQIVYCLDTLRLFPGLEQLSDMDEDAPEPFIIWGQNTNYNFYYAFNYLTDEVIMLDDLKSPEPNMYCAASGAKLLDCLYVAAQCERMRLLYPEQFEVEKESMIDKAAIAAGGKKYREHCKLLVG